MKIGVVPPLRFRTFYTYDIVYIVDRRYRVSTKYSMHYRSGTSCIHAGPSIVEYKVYYIVIYCRYSGSSISCTFRT